MLIERRILFGITVIQVLLYFMWSESGELFKLFCQLANDVAIDRVPCAKPRRRPGLSLKFSEIMYPEPC